VVTVLMYVAYTAYVLAALLMIGAVLLQEGKGGGLSALGGTPAESAFGASNPIRRMTVVLSIVFFLLAGFLSYVSSRSRIRFEPPAAGPAAAAAPSAPSATAPAEKAPQEAAKPQGAPAPPEAGKPSAGPGAGAAAPAPRTEGQGQ